MTNKPLADLAEKMREIDICMLSTHTDGGAIAGRPMSNNRNVDYDGSSYYFTLDDTRMVDDIKADPKVALAFQGAKAFLVAVEGKADLIRDRQAFREHWSADIDKWFADGIDTEGLVMIKVVAERAHYWDGEDEGEVTLKA
ncbi:general stress protein 26 [Rhizobium sp. PP-F2F-G38]|nr:general stress protein 26 [Rhizobium sp. PP-WC-1G-195]PYE98525.1 general stress protein 26 [Rhizobium sp. PP-F2F-G38]